MTMEANRMHEKELSLTTEEAAALVYRQFPEYESMPIQSLGSVGTMNTIFRIGDSLCARFPRLEVYSQDLERDWIILAKLSGTLPLQIPEPIALGEPETGYPCRWAIYRWIEGETCSTATIADELEAAAALAGFVQALHAAEPSPGIPPAGRPRLAALDDEIIQATRESADLINAERVLQAWERARTAPEWDGKPVWIHSDLLPTNILTRQRRISAVIDFGGAGQGDPAFDLIPAWSVFSQQGREKYKEALNPTGGDWERARGYALHQALLILPYYRTSYPEFSQAALRTIEEVLKELDYSGNYPC